MIKQVINLITLLLFVVIVSCSILKNGNDGSNSNNTDAIVDVTDSSTADIVLYEWKKDKLGCLGYRNALNTKMLVNKYRLKNKGEKELIKILGDPNNTVDEKDGIKYRQLIFYFDAACNNGRILDSLDYCWVSFKIDVSSDKIVSIDYICI